MPSIYLDYTNYDISIKELQSREIKNNVDIKVSNIFNKYRNTKLMLTVRHPNTFLFLSMVRKICLMLNIDFFNPTQYFKYVKNTNYMELP